MKKINIEMGVYRILWASIFFVFLCSALGWCTKVEALLAITVQLLCHILTYIVKINEKLNK